MAYYDVLWNPEPDGNIAHIAEHDLTPEDVEEVLFHPVGHDTLYPITAYEIDA